MKKSVGDITAVILAGGRSRRFGSNKAFASFKGQTLIGHVLDVVADIFDKIVIVTNTPHLYQGVGAEVICDEVPYLGPLGGITTALKKTKSDGIFVVSCDMPFVTCEAVNSILRKAGKHEAVVGRTAGGIEPLFAFYKRSTLEIFETRLAGKDLSVKSALKDISDVCCVDIESRILTNINYAGELDGRI